MGTVAGATSPARTHTPLAGAEIALTAGTSAAMPLRPDFEYAILALDGEVRGYDGGRLPAPPMPITRLVPRGRVR